MISLEQGRERALHRKYGGPGGFIPHQAEPNAKGWCGLCHRSERSAEHMAYEVAYVDAMPNHPFVAKAPDLVGTTGRTTDCKVCGMPAAHPLHDDQPTVVSPAPSAAGAVDPLLGQPKQAASYTGTGCMVALYPDAAGLAGIKTMGNLPLEKMTDMHVTVCYLPSTPDGPELELLKSVVADMARTQGPLTGVWGGTGRFNPSEGSDGKPVLVALPDLPELSAFRQDLVEALSAAGFDVATSHGYTPHLTVAYNDNGQVRAEGDLGFDTLTLKTPTERFDSPLTGEIDTERAEATDAAVEMGKIAQGVDAAVDDALTHLRSCADLPPYAQQARAVLQGVEPACDALLAYFGVSDADDDGKTDSEMSRLRPETAKQKHRYVGKEHLRDGVVRGAGYFSGCYACGQSSNDPDHDGDVDQPGVADNDAAPPAQSAAALSANQVDESAQIELNKKVPYSQAAHPFLPSLYQDSVTCLMCGQREPDQGATCLPAAPKVPAEPDPLVMAAVTGFRDRAFVEIEATQLPKERAFLTEVAGRTIITGPASVMGIEKAMTPNEQFLWMQGRFVGAEKANRNGAFWTTADLEMGAPTVRYGPLNWLHEAKHIIGTLADQRLVVPNVEQAAEGAEPHIWALAPIWKWIYPDEAYVVEAASDAGNLWFSMECISKEVECVGDGGCGAKTSYGDYLAATRPGSYSTKACEHMRQKSAIRRFAEPTFLGCGIIVPPVRPGWAEADARVIRQAAALAESTYEQAGRPANMTASDWEVLMASVVGYAML